MSRNFVDHRFRNFPNGPDVFTMWEDFNDEFTVGSADKWTGTALSSGTAVLTRDENLGILRLSGAATTDNSGYQIQGDMEYVSLNAAKRVRYISRSKNSDGTQDEVFTGLSITDTTILDGGGTLAVADVTGSDMVGIYKPDGGTTIYGFVNRDSVMLSTGGKSLTMTDYNILAFQVTMDPLTAGKGHVDFFANGEWFGRIDSTTMPYDTEEILTPSFAFVTGDATGTKTCDIDYIGVEIER